MEINNQINEITTTIKLLLSQIGELIKPIGIHLNDYFGAINLEGIGSLFFSILAILLVGIITSIMSDNDTETT